MRNLPAHKLLRKVKVKECELELQKIIVPKGRDEIPFP